MKYVELVPGIKSSAIGFGCAPVMGSVDRERSLRAMAVALESGVTHFDIAPSYGYGEAEKLLGQFMVGKRDQVVIATKFGIEVNPMAVVLRPLKSTARKVIGILKRRSSGDGKGVTSGLAGSMHRHVPIQAETMVASVERSLARLRTDRIDYLFLHEPPETIADPDAVFRAAEKLKQQGKLRGFGLAAMIHQVGPHREYLDRFDVLQFNAPADTASYRAMQAERGDKPNILFSSFRAAEALGVDVKQKGPGSLLRDLHRDFPRTVILCSMFSENHIRENAKALDV